MTIPIFVVPQNIQPHPRIIIRKYVNELLKVNTDLGGKWFCSRPNPLFLDQVPCGLVYYSDEQADHEKTVPRNYRKDLSLVTEVMLRMKSERDSAAEDWLDSRAYEIEYAICADRFLGLRGLVQDAVLTRTQPVTIETDGDTDIDAVRLFWTVIYRQDLTNISVLEEFLKFTNKINGTNSEQSEDRVTIRQI